MTESANLVKRLPNDIGLTAGPISKVDHELLPWEKRCHALADVLDFHKIINTEEKRRCVESLGSEMINALSYYERWIVAFANILFKRVCLHLNNLQKKWQISNPDRRSSRTYNLEELFAALIRSNLLVTHPGKVSICASTLRGERTCATVALGT
jgi:hypothetical protein